MKKFIFRLETILIERKRQEDFKLREWSIVNRMLIDLQTELSGLEKSLEHAFVAASELKSMPVLSIATILAQESYIEGLRLKIEWKRNDISRAIKFVDRKKQEWLLFRKNRMILDKLKEKKRLEHKKEVYKKELKDLDDMNTMRARLSLSEEEV